MQVGCTNVHCQICLIIIYYFFHITSNGYFYDITQFLNVLIGLQCDKKYNYDNQTTISSKVNHGKL